MGDVVEASADAGSALHKDRTSAVAWAVGVVHPIPDSSTAARNGNVWVVAGDADVQDEGAGDRNRAEGIVAAVQQYSHNGTLFPLRQRLCPHHTQLPSPYHLHRQT